MLNFVDHFSMIIFININFIQTDLLYIFLLMTLDIFNLLTSSYHPSAALNYSSDMAFRFIEHYCIKSDV